MRRGDVVIAALRGHYTGKPRPAIVMQTDALNDRHASILLAPMTTEVLDLHTFRVRVRPTAMNGLAELSEIMVDKIAAVPRERIGKVIGVMEQAVMVDLNRAIAVVFNLVQSGASQS